MRIEKKLNIRLALEDITYLESEEELNTSIQSEPDRRIYQSVLDAIKRFFGMSPRDLYQFATEGGSIEEDTIIIDSLIPQLIVEQQVHRVVQSGNYAKVLEIRMPGPGFAYKGFIVTKLGLPNSEVEKALQARMTNWKPGDPVPFKWYKTESEALKAMSDAETKAAGKAPTPAKPPKQKVSKKPVNELAAKMAQQMGNQEAAGEIVNMTPENIIKFADLGIKTKKPGDTWKMAKTVFLAYLALSALVTGAAGLAALVIGYLAVKGWEASRRLKEDLDDLDIFGSPCRWCELGIPGDPNFHETHIYVAEDLIKRGLAESDVRYYPRRKWGVDPEAFISALDEAMSRYGYTRDMSGDQMQWVRQSPE